MVDFDNIKPIRTISDSDISLKFNLGKVFFFFLVKN